ncbi:spindle and kinetochore-associated protein 1-like [Diachasmimorpha longicaudata]|uniref:spindle and kinetochore-associated protein 1-like n=1 Tax=Diachasmimorpha longicaudata TaxID=58733 RepID=UPI0030B8BA07
MTSIQSLEDVINKQVQRITQLQMATAFLQNKEELKDVLLDAKQDIELIKKGLFGQVQILEKMRNQNELCKTLSSNLLSLDKKIVRMSNNVPESLLELLAKAQTQGSKAPITTVSEASKKDHNTLETKAHLVVNDMNTEEVKDCRKALFREADDLYSIDALTEDEFSKIPKYMIGRQTLVNVNAFVGTINQIMKAKYSLLSLGKTGARKKGELDLYLQFKKEESDVKGTSSEKIYFFSADDYLRETKLKLDKTKLNLMTVLRHCKRIHELRSGKTVRYQVITSL